MTWHHIEANWSFWRTRLLDRFPYLCAQGLNDCKADRIKFEFLLAHTHDLTMTEARSAVEDFLLVEAFFPRCNNPEAAAE